MGMKLMIDFPSVYFDSVGCADEGRGHTAKQQQRS